MNRPRRLCIWRYSQGVFGHDALGVSYEVDIDGFHKLRFLKAEVMFSEEEGLMLLFDGPSKRNEPGVAVDHTLYRKSLAYVYDSSLAILNEICRSVFKDFGNYNEATNNCKHFVSQVLDKFEPFKLDAQYSGFEFRQLARAHLSQGVAPDYEKEWQAFEEAQQIEMIWEAERWQAGAVELMSHIAELKKSLDAIGNDHPALCHEVGKQIAELESQLEQIQD